MKVIHKNIYTVIMLASISNTIHDRNGQALFYDSQGNTKRNRTEHEIAVTDTVAAVAVAYVAPVVMFQALPIETLKMIFGNR